MGLTLNLGVVEVPYSHAAVVTHAKKRKATSTGASTQTTYSVAKILEEKYGVMQFFWNKYENQIVEHLHEAIKGELESAIMGKPISREALSAGTEEVQAMFQAFLTNREMDGMVGGVPTAASLAGRTLRKKNKKGPVRPSFISSGLYQSSFRSWVE